MKKRLTMLLTLCCLLGAFAMPASALEYTFDSPSTGDFGTPTSSSQAPYLSLHPSDEAHSFPCSSSSDCNRYAGLQSDFTKDPNMDRSKNSSLIPPGFGTPTSYLPNSGEYLTPNLAAGGPLNTPSLSPSQLDGALRGLNTLLDHQISGLGVHIQLNHFLSNFIVGRSLTGPPWVLCSW